MSSLIPPLTPKQKGWYRTEKNTSALIRSVVSSGSTRNLSGDQIWSLITLTWITINQEGVSPNHWKKLKLPALALLFNKANPKLEEDLSETIDSMSLPQAVAQSAKQDTGIVNFRGTWRNSSREWCGDNLDALTKIISAAVNLPKNDQARFDLATRIDELPPVKSPDNKAKLPAGVLLTPLIACLDCITSLWFGNESCKQISGGEGKAWSAVAEFIGHGT
jgi:hypothetical protein